MKRLEWIQEFLSQPSSFVFVDINPDFLIKSLNDANIQSKVENYEEAKKLIISNIKTDENVQQQAEILYGLIHAKYLNTIEGMEKMVIKQKNKIFPHCPRIFCRKTICVPYGITDELRDKTIKMFCPNCHEFYNVTDDRISKIDGAYFGPTWVDLMCQNHKELELQEKPEYVPRIFGFRIYHPPEEPNEEKPATD